MTEQEWLECADPEPMLEYLRDKDRERKLRLFGVACCRRIWHLLIDERSRNAVLSVERYADGQCSSEELAIAFRESEHAFRKCEYGADRHADAAGAANELTVVAITGQRLIHVALGSGNALGYADDRCYFPDNAVAQAEYSNQCHLLRDIVGNPFRPVIVDGHWLAPTVVALAYAIYDERAFDRLPILADALKDAGCENADILNHCREPREHVRGCWVIDLLLGKE